ncbi:hypothetical protein BDY24DRAFT_415724 [Mrakia frigida]|uniref:kynurenine 3-monooxygenase n=1 Tax=Mrakia frigida TaxID=29902 RepID=UPI003FCC0AF4
MSDPSRKKAIVIGAGPVGCLTALSLANNGWEVEIWEGRPDPSSEKGKAEPTRSVNLAISSRGIAALASVEPDLVKDFIDLSLPMKGRMIWDFSNKQNSQLYDPIHGSCINSISRPLLSSTILDRAASHPLISVRFERKVGKVDWRTRTVYPAAPSGSSSSKGESGGGGGWIEEGKETGWDLLVGGDGSWSVVRKEMMRVQAATYTQTQIPHVWVELNLPPGPPNLETGEAATFSISPEHLHIWPRHEFMLIALPNKDKSFTMTLYAPAAAIEALSTRELARAFFKKNFSPPLATSTSSSAPDPTQVDILSLMGEERVLDDFMAARRGALVIISVDPISYPSGGGVLLGDAGHSMVPFYGQGLNCGLEDVRVLASILASHSITGTTGSTSDLEAALKEFSEVRKDDLKAILQLALSNYDEMKSKVLSPLHLLRRHLDHVLSLLLPPPTSPAILSSLASSRAPTSTSTPPPANPFPQGRVQRWTSLYHMVTFRPDVGYAEALRRENWQKDLVTKVVETIGLGVVGGLVWGGWWVVRSGRVGGGLVERWRR